MPSPITRLVLFAVLIVACAAEPPVSHPLAAAPPRAPHHVYLPAQYDASRAWPLVLLLHGYTGNAGLMDFYLGMSRRTSQHGFILVAPEGTRNSKGQQFWNATSFCCDFERSGVDDVTYLKGLVADLQRDYNVDERAIFAVGHSNGGFMAHTLACDESGLLAGIASIAGSTFGDPAACHATRAVSTLQIHAADDPTVLYAGSADQYPGARETQERWARLDGCAEAPEEGAPFDATQFLPGDETTPLVWKGCQDDARVELWTIRAKRLGDPAEHQPHVPWPAPDFTDRVLRFLMESN